MLVPPPPPPPPPPPAAPQALIPPPTNKNLLASIEMGTKLKKVPEAAKNDRSSATVAIDAGSSNNSNTGRRVSQSNGGKTLSKPALNNSAMEFQSQLRNQLMTMHSETNGAQDKKTAPTVTYPSVRPALNKGAAPNNTSASVNKPFTKQLSSGNFPMSNNTTCYTQQSQSSQVNNRAPPSLGVTNKPQIAKTPQSALLTNKPAPMIPNATASRPQYYLPQCSNNQPSPHMFNTTNNRPLSSSQDLAIKNKAPIQNQFQVTNNRALTSSNPQPSNIKAPAPNQPQFANTRAPPPPPSKTKPLQRNSISMEHIRPILLAATSSENIIRQRPLSQAPSVDTNSRRSSIVTRTTANPPPPVPDSLRPQITHNTPMPPAPPLPSRVTAQSLPVNQSTSQPYKMADRAPPPPPPPGGNRASLTCFYSNFDSRFTFPNENQFPNM